MVEGITDDFLREAIKNCDSFPGVEYKIGQHALDNMKGKIESFVEDLVEQSIHRATVFNDNSGLRKPITIREHDVIMSTLDVYSKHSEQLEEFRKIPLNERSGCDV